MGSEGPDQNAHPQFFLELRCPHMPDDTFSYGAVYLCSVPLLTDARCIFKYIFKLSKAFADHQQLETRSEANFLTSLHHILSENCKYLLHY